MVRMLKRMAREDEERKEVETQAALAGLALEEEEEAAKVQEALTLSFRAKVRLFVLCRILR